MKASPIARLATPVAALLLCACSEIQNPVTPTEPTFTSSQSTTYSGHATVVQAAVLGLSPITLVEAGPLPSSGGADEETLVEANVPGLLSAEALHASTVAQGNHSSTEASVAEVAVTVAGNSVSAGFLMARAEAKCTDGTASAAGSSEIAQLKINGQAIVVNGTPNQTIPLPNGRVIINEQKSGGAGDLTVNALHIVVDGIADIVVASAHADIGCPSNPPPPPPQACADFMTGGGTIAGTPSGARANFGVAGGVKNDAFWGHLSYIDHGPNGPKVKGTGVTAYVVLGPTSRRIEGTAEINGQPGFTYRVDLADEGEPGRADGFVIKLSSGYAASGQLTGGNLQLHRPCS